MDFVNYGPAFLLRNAYLSATNDYAWCIYSSLKPTVKIKKFQMNRNLIEYYFRPLYTYYFHDDQKLLDKTSTSPKQERPSYLINMKKIVLYILKYYEVFSEWFDQRTELIVFYWSNNKWTTDNTKIVDDIEMK